MRMYMRNFVPYRLPINLLLYTLHYLYDILIPRKCHYTYFTCKLLDSRLPRRAYFK